MREHTNPDLSLLLDENISPNIVPRLWEANVDAVSIRDRGMLRSADHRVLAYAERESRVTATIDMFDFSDLVAKKKTHPGVWVIPSGGTREDQLDYLLLIAEHARGFGGDPMMFCRDNIIAINEDFQISRKQICAPQNQIRVITGRGA